MKTKIFILVLFVLIIPVIVLAHPGNTASDGAHYCRTNCDYWGVPWNQRHSHGGGSSYAPSYNNYYSSPVISACPSNSYESGGSCKCNYGYVVDGGQCVSGNTYCSSELGIMSTYDSLTNSCKCMSGYEIGALGLCTYKSNYSKYSSSLYSNLYSDYLYGSKSNYSCPAHSSESLTDSDQCTCDLGYEVNSKKTKCVKIKKQTNDKLCRADYGPKSKWTGKYDEDTRNPLCGCDKKYEWSSDGASCVKSG